MIGIETVLVLGAGASAPFEFPTSQGLKDDICRQSVDVSTSLNALKRLGFDRDKLEGFRVTLRPITLVHEDVYTFLHNYVIFGRR